MNNRKVILGVGGLVHDAQLTYLKHGVPEIILEEERVTRKKHIGGTYDKSFSILKERYKMDEKKVDYIAVARKDVPEVWKNKTGVSVNDFLKKFPKEKIYKVDHHLAHAASCFYPSGYKKAAILTVDAIGDDVATWIGYGEDTQIKEFHRINYLHSLGFLWIRTSKILGYEDIFSAGTVMAMAAYGKPRYYRLFKSIIKLEKDGTYEINPGKYKWEEVARFWDKEKPFFILKALGIKPRKLGEPIKQIYFDIAASLQKITEDVILHMVKSLYKKTKSENICVAGGVFLNGYVNQKIVEETDFKNIFIQPAASDVGDGLGASLYLYHHVLKNKRKWIMKNAYLGMDFSEKEIEEVLRKNKDRLIYEKKRNIEKVTARLLSEDKIVGWVQGRAEYGPRALGNRSILADPRRKRLKSVLNEIKEREWFRPIAPSIVAERAKDFFDIYLPSKYMIIIGKANSKNRKKIPAVLHKDNSVRVQTVTRQDNPRYYKLIKEFERLTKIPIVCNTSFNKKGEPIVNSPLDAVGTFLDCPKINHLIIGDYLISRR